MSPEPGSGRSANLSGLLSVLIIVSLGCNYKTSDDKSGSGQSDLNEEKKEKQGEKETSALDNLIAKNPAIQGSHDRLALLESFSSLDRLVIDRSFASTVLSSKQFMAEEKVKLAQDFTAEIKSYKSLEKLRAFSNAVDQLLITPPSSSQDARLEKLRGLQGSGQVIANSRDSDLLGAFGNIITQRMTQLRAHKQIEQLKSVFDNHWHQKLKRQGIEVTSPKDQSS